MTKQIDTTTKAIPGERYLRLIEALSGKDEKARNEALSWIKQISGVDIAADLLISAEFKYGAGLPVAAALLQATSMHAADIEAALTNRYLALKDVGTMHPIAARDAAEAEIRTNVLQFLGHIGGKMSWNGNTNEVSYSEPLLSPTWPQMRSFAERRKDKRIQTTKANAELWHHEMHYVAAQSLVKALMLQYDKPMSNADQPWVLSRPVSLLRLDARPFLLVVMDKRVFDDHEDDLRIRISVHEAKTPGKPLNGQEWKVVPPQEDPGVKSPFRIDPPFRLKDGREVVYAVYNLTDSFPWGSDLVQRLDALAESLKAK